MKEITLIIGLINISYSIQSKTWSPFDAGNILWFFQDVIDWTQIWTPLNINLLKNLVNVLEGS